jgi:hypothetical protein
VPRTPEHGLPLSRVRDHLLDDVRILVQRFTARRTDKGYLVIGLVMSARGYR